jgi:hypothetical protein
LNPRDAAFEKGKTIDCISQDELFHSNLRNRMNKNASFILPQKLVHVSIGVFKSAVEFLLFNQANFSALPIIACTERNDNYEHFIVLYFILFKNLEVFILRPQIAQAISAYLIFN